MTIRRKWAIAARGAGDGHARRRVQRREQRRQLGGFGAAARDRCRGGARQQRHHDQARGERVGGRRGERQRGAQNLLETSSGTRSSSRRSTSSSSSRRSRPATWTPRSRSGPPVHAEGLQELHRRRQRRGRRRAARRGRPDRLVHPDVHARRDHPELATWEGSEGQGVAMFATVRDGLVGPDCWTATRASSPSTSRSPTTSAWTSRSSTPGRRRPSSPRLTPRTRSRSRSCSTSGRRTGPRRSTT